MDSKLIKVGDIIYVKNHEDKPATIVDEKKVDFNGRKIKINEYAKEVTGWSTICIYDWLYLKSNGKALGEMRDTKLQESGYNWKSE